ncbi:MAG: DUF721 domain-containing protein [Alphaproteobacteria bacterium]|nr:DUF721 domain-containing protein [Alphaproteobacteria bacterium]
MADKIKIRTEHTLHDLTGIAQTAMPVVKQLLGKQGFYMLELLNNWRCVIGSELAKYTLPYKLSFKKDERSNGCLTLITISGAFAMEIKQKQQLIINKVNSYFGYEAVSTIKILQTGNAEDFLYSKKPLENIKKSVVSQEQENYITELVKNIDSPQLREIVEKLGRQVVLENK